MRHVADQIRWDFYHLRQRAITVKAIGVSIDILAELTDGNQCYVAPNEMPKIMGVPYIELPAGAGYFFQLEFK